MKISIKEMSLVGIFAGLTAMGAFISIPLGDLPITLQTLFVILSGLILGPKLGALSQIVYIFLGLIGLPIFAGFTGGLQSVMKPSFGFVIGFVFASYVVGKISHSARGFNNNKVWLAGLVGTIITYLFGLPYMYYILNIVMVRDLSFYTIMNIGCFLFLPGDLIKLVIASLVAIRIMPILKNAGLIIN